MCQYTEVRTCSAMNAALQCTLTPNTATTPLPESTCCCIRLVQQMLPCHAGTNKARGHQRECGDAWRHKHFDGHCQSWHHTGETLAHNMPRTMLCSCCMGILSRKPAHARSATGGAVYVHMLLPCVAQQPSTKMLQNIHATTGS